MPKGGRSHVIPHTSEVVLIRLTVARVAARRQVLSAHRVRPPAPDLGCPTDRAAAFRLHEEAAASGNADAMFELYAMLARGVG